MKTIEYAELLGFAKTLEGVPMKTTMFGDEFTVKVRDGGFEYVATSGHFTRFHDASVVKQYLGKFNEEQSLEPGDYRDTPVNADYFLAVVDRYLQGHREISEWAEPRGRSLSPTLTNPGVVSVAVAA